MALDSNRSIILTDDMVVAINDYVGKEVFREDHVQKRCFQGKIGDGSVSVVLHPTDAYARHFGVPISQKSFSEYFRVQSYTVKPVYLPKESKKECGQVESKNEQAYCYAAFRIYELNKDGGPQGISVSEEKALIISAALFGGQEARELSLNPEFAQQIRSLQIAMGVLNKNGIYMMGFDQ